MKVSISWGDLDLPLVPPGGCRPCSGLRGRPGHDLVWSSNQRELTRFAWSKSQQRWNSGYGRLNATAVTADRVWVDIDVRVPVELIR